jgi:hypothetical protein
MSKTKAQIETELAAARQELQTYRTRVLEAEARIPSTPRRVPEADALAQCIRAIDVLDRDDSSTSYSHGKDTIRHRVIRAVIERYGYKIPEPITITAAACDRRHLDEASEPELINMLRNPNYNII